MIEEGGSVAGGMEVRGVEGRSNVGMMGEEHGMAELCEDRARDEGTEGVCEGVAVSSGVGTSQLGGASGSSNRVVPGSRSEGLESRCSMNVMWKELKMFPEVLSHNR
jgi:hypothetical protein